MQTLWPHRAELPKERIECNINPFENTAIDFFGPLEVTILGKAVKHGCCLLTCLVNRMVHIEVVQGLDTDACMMAITRFMARRGKSHTVISDFGTIFVGATREFRQ